MEYTKVKSKVNPFLEECNEKYYMIGYVLGDGSLSSKGTPGLVISSSDLEYFRLLHAQFGEYSVPKPNRGNYAVKIRDEEIYRQLILLGFKERKSFEGMECPKVPIKYATSFLAGLLDSDGSAKQTNKNSLQLVWYGHESYMFGVYSLLVALGYHPTYRTHCKKNNLKAVAIGATVEAVDLGKKLYTNLTVYNPTKRQKILQQYNVSGGRSRSASEELNSKIRENVPTNRTELLILAKGLGISESNLTKRLDRMGLKYKANYGNSGRYERKHKESV